MNLADIFAVNSLVWPLTFIFVSLVVLRQLRDQVAPIFRGMVSSLTVQSSRYAMAWTFAALTATLAALQSLQEVCQQMHWVYIGAAAKVLQPGLAVLVAYGRAQPTNGTNGTPGSTPSTAPFPVKT